MKKVVPLLIISAVVALTLYVKTPPNKNNLLVPSVANVSPSPSLTAQNVQPATTSLFVPYWGLGNFLPDTYDEYLYFGVAVTAKGINTNEAGYKNIPRFIEIAPTSSKKFLVLRMTDSKTNFSIIEDKNIAKEVITDTVNLAQKYRFDGIVLDLEVTSLPFDSVINNISTFAADFAKKSHENSLLFYSTIYGDVFYRIRPYDVEELAKHSDKLLIMAYDFHKAGGADPGPNFPLSGKEKYGYDFDSMIADFLKFVPKEKLSVALGLYGYDWVVDENGKAESVGKALRLVDIKDEFVPCDYANCIVVKDEASGETKITYQDNDGEKHVLWYEDKESASKKREFLKGKGVNSVSYWIHSYF